jgi:5S rRNA maturation endonuclease (ribonuclease M5)
MKWNRVNKRQPCPICKHPDWCIIAPDKSAVLCMRHMSRTEKRLKDGCIGWIHRLTEQTVTARSRPATPTPEELSMDFPSIMARYAMGTLPGMYDELAQNLSVSTDSLIRLGAKWAAKYNAWAFPMTDGFGEVVGIRLRMNDGHKWSVRGSHSGAFVPTGLTGAGPLMVCEGATDTAAMLDLGFDAIGRPSCNGGARELLNVLDDKDQTVVIVADNDPPGQRGAAMLALQLTVKTIIITPHAKDVRAWKQAGATHAIVSALIASTRPCDKPTLRKLIEHYSRLISSSTNTVTCTPTQEKLSSQHLQEVGRF